MTFGSYLWTMRVSTVFALAGWVFVILYVDPEKTGIAGQLLFYLMMFLSFSGIFTLIISWLRRKYAGYDGDSANSLARVSFRQGILLAVLLVIMMFFQGNGILVWWDGMLAAAGIFLIELFFLSRGD